MTKSTHGDRYEDDGILFESFDFEGTKLRVRVGPVFSGNVAHPEQGIWIDLGNEEFLMSQGTFISLNDHIHRRIDEWKKFRDILNEGDL